MNKNKSVHGHRKELCLVKIAYNILTTVNQNERNNEQF